MPSRRADVIQAARKVSYFTHPKAKAARIYRQTSNPGGCNVATVKYRVISTGATGKKTLESNKRHTEGLLYDWLEATHPNDYTVDWLYTELETCGSDYHDCTARVGQWFPGATIYYSVDYPAQDEVSTDDDDDKSDVRETQRRKRLKAKRRRARSTPLLKRFSTKLKNRAIAGEDSSDEVEFDDFRPALRVPYSPSRDDASLDPGVKL